jgi:hypothetical protein
VRRGANPRLRGRRPRPSAGPPPAAEGSGRAFAAATLSPPGVHGASAGRGGGAGARGAQTRVAARDSLPGPAAAKSPALRRPRDSENDRREGGVAAGQGSAAALPVPCPPSLCPVPLFPLGPARAFVAAVSRPCAGQRVPQLPEPGGVARQPGHALCGSPRVVATLKWLWRRGRDGGREAWKLSCSYFASAPRYLETERSQFPSRPPIPPSSLWSTAVSWPQAQWRGHRVASSGKLSGGRTMGRPGERGSGAACTGGSSRRKGPRTRRGSPRVQLRAAPLFGYRGGGLLWSGFLPGMGLILGPTEGREGKGAGLEWKPD